MPKFRVAIIRTETHVFVIESQNSSEAVEKVSDAWDEGLIDIDNLDTSDTDFSLIGRANENVRAAL